MVEAIRERRGKKKDGEEGLSVFDAAIPGLQSNGKLMYLDSCAQRSDAGPDAVAADIHAG
jgi:hypothetical protein